MPFLLQTGLEHRKTYQKNHPENKLKMGDDEKLVIDSEFSYPLEAKESTYTLDELTVEEQFIGEYKKRAGKTLSTETQRFNIDNEIAKVASLHVGSLGRRSVYERKIKLSDYDFIVKESEPWTVYGTEKTQSEIAEIANIDARYATILEEMQEKEAESVIELPDGGFVIADENHVPAKKLSK